MCGRFNITADPLTRLLMALVNMPYTGLDNANAAPTEMIPVLRITPAGEDGEGKPELVPMRWWLTPFWSKAPSTRYSMFNAKAETAETSPAFREPWRKRRCVVPVSGFYEWCRSASVKVPYLIRASRHGGLLLAGLWDHWRNPESGDELLSFTVLTQAAHPDIAFVHSRQPVMLSIAQARRWLAPEVETDEMRDLFSPRLPMALDIVPVSSEVNNARHKSADVARPVGDIIHVRGLEG
ncbi:MAG: SOS response-associated peptidase [Pseudomonadales bacterium]